MECPRRWTVPCTLLFFLIQTAYIHCQIEPRQETTHHQTKDLKRDLSKQFITSSSSTSSIPNIQDDRLRTLNAISQGPSFYPQDPAFLNQPGGSINIPNLVLTPQYSTLHSQDGSCSGVTRMPLENNANMVPQLPAVWQFPQPSNDVYNYPSVNSQFTSPCSILPTINTQSGVNDFLSEINQGALFQESTMQQNGYEDNIPLNLQINIPSQNVPGPRITVIAATPAPVTSENPNPVQTIPQYLPAPLPIITKKSRSYLKDLLPILLIALLNDQCGNGCCCPCNCNCNDSFIPIPYPIPIPINNPIINNDYSSHSSRSRGYKVHEEGNVGSN